MYKTIEYKCKTPFSTRKSPQYCNSFQLDRRSCKPCRKFQNRSFLLYSREALSNALVQRTRFFLLYPRVSFSDYDCGTFETSPCAP